MRSSEKNSDSMARAVLEDVDGIGNEGGASEMMRTRSRKELVLVRVQTRRLGTT